jgi:hypothetical protein
MDIARAAKYKLKAAPIRKERLETMNNRLALKQCIGQK